MGNGYILGVWDGHDSGAAIAKGKNILFAREEGFTGRKAEMRFPVDSIRTVIKNSGIDAIAFSTSDLAKTITRFFPSLKEEYFLARTSKKKGLRRNAIKKAKYLITLPGPNRLLRALSRFAVKKELKKIGLDNIPLYLLEHHVCHAEGARFSGFKECLVITLDGLGDGLSGSISIYSKGKIMRKSRIPSRDSFGIFYEHATNILGMKELQDEGKVMLMAGKSKGRLPNPMLDLFRVEGVNARASYGPLGLYKELKKIKSACTEGEFAFMAQRSLEEWISRLVENAMKGFGQKNLCLSGGVFANTHLVKKIKKLKCVKKLFVFPYMGDGGLAIGAAVSLNSGLNHITDYKLKNINLIKSP